MDVTIIKTRKDADRINLENTSYMEDAVGFWGNVIDVDSSINSVDVISDTGIRYFGIPVVSNEWVYSNEDKEYVAGSRNLPPHGARVFVLAPTRTATGAFVLCSGYAMGDVKKQKLFADKDSESDIKKKNDIDEQVLIGGWNIKRFYKTGNIVIEDLSKDIHFEANGEEDSDNEQKKEIKIIAWEHEIKINEDGLVITDANKNKITTKNDGLVIEDTNGNTITGSNSGWDLNGYLTVASPPPKPSVGA